MKLPEEFSFMNEGKDFPEFIRKGKRSDKNDEIYSYSSKNVARTNILLFGEVFDKATIYKYIDRRKFIQYVKAQKEKHNDGFSICFQEPSLWPDPYESRFYKAVYSEVFKNVDFVKNNHMKLYACCFASHMESEPSWKMYVNDSDNTDRKVCIQLKINFKALLDYLNYYIKNELKGDFMLVVGLVKYMDKSAINKLHRPDEKGELNNTFFKDFSYTKYLKLLKLKRKAYIYEDEIRLFLIPTKDEVVKGNIVIPIPAECPTNVKSKEKWGNIIEKLYLDPDSRDDELEAYKKQFEDLNIGIDPDKFDFSDLYSSFSNIIIGETKDDEVKRKQKEIQEDLEKRKKNLDKRMKASL